ncbi:bifunctional diaminohydroxyphosphoribosylaminopyrimidine deaminase/5-amino-6-(5-phosphoribosylamino)uracil reductase RibD [Alteromonas mediterranea]|uniref:bifunctional diaminohydroxyphosphoribosylaminopyrimidine deaminase/5-amino-6-(5-phosphoribosylamino)uracil reductase RibD n=1 Tax=Alteromonas mediterranea TaxID=314275 RepID=UPI001131AC94|nr:bifunctional diaminohydroxyphosphoribosylaminopyrimidine deaminase/5-amino-6-(5-phosphoribosylamino)uracil reductase RibD [Alteromonas mediterranea]QDG35488.1 bifunctional diaminohydroxyphosphoribosylaminopyrimidine deaminase/5-amino-6-(5-phosphoribosylamino)uracil reductase RibD [Alteromonas mediterranea]
MNHDTVKNDYYWMAKAIQLAKKGRFTTSPNPRVGCVIVDEDSQLLGQGYHIQAGTPHAEVHALRQAAHARSEGAKGATAYVTLEPCSHFGRTPPCAKALVEAQVARVVIAMTDPNPNVCGNGISMLQEAGIEVVSEVMAAEAAALNPGFIKRMLTGKPFVRVKLGISVDGKIALQNGVSQWITTPEARRDVQHYRAQSCVVLTGSGTVKADNPSLLVREKEAQFDDYPLEHVRQPARVVVDSKSTLGRDYALFNDGNMTFTATSQAHPDTASQHYLQLDEKDGKLDLHALMLALGDKQFNEVWVEAGPGLTGALLQEGLVDELICYQAPKLLGDKGVSMVNLPAFTALNQSISLSLIENRQVGNDIKLIFRPDVSNTCR